MSNKPVRPLSRFLSALLTVCFCLATSCVSVETQQLTEKHGDEMRTAFGEYIGITSGGAQYGDTEALRKVVTERHVKKELFSANSEVRDLLVRYEIVDIQVLEYTPERARILIHWKGWHHNVNVMTGEEGAANLLEVRERLVFVKEEGKWKVDEVEWGERIYPPEP